MLDKIISYIKGLLNFSYPNTLKMSNKKVFVDFKQNTNPWKILLLLVKHKYSHKLYLTSKRAKILKYNTPAHLVLRDSIVKNEVVSRVNIHFLITCIFIS